MPQYGSVSAEIPEKTCDRETGHVQPLKPDWKAIQRRVGGTRPPERLIAHYEIERRLSDRLRAAPRNERPRVYSEVYSELFESLPDHPQKTTKDTCGARVVNRVRLLAPLLKPDATYLEIGCGNAMLPFALAGRAREVLGLDVTDALIDFAAAPANFRFVPTNGIDIPLADESVDLAHSDQLMEHLHVDDAEAQVAEIHRVLKAGGQYLCSTPNRLTGPHDISVFFDDTATGFHLREYDYGSLRDLLLRAGFSSVRFPLVVYGFQVVTPSFPVLQSAERLVERAPSWLRYGQLAVIAMGMTALATK